MRMNSIFAATLTGVALPASAQTIAMSNPSIGVRCVSDRMGDQLVKLAADYAAGKIEQDALLNAMSPHEEACKSQYAWNYPAQRRSAFQYATATASHKHNSARLTGLGLDAMKISGLYGKLPASLISLLQSQTLDAETARLTDKALQDFVVANSAAKSAPASLYATDMLKAEARRRSAVDSYARISEQIKRQASPSAPQK